MPVRLARGNGDYSRVRLRRRPFQSPGKPLVGDAARRACLERSRRDVHLTQRAALFGVLYVDSKNRNDRNLSTRD